MAASHRLARLLEMITLFRGSGCWRPRDLAAKFGISETRVYQDIQELNRAGVAVMFASNGYRLDDNCFLPALNLTPEDVLELLYPDALFKDGDPSKLNALRAKILAALDPEQREKYGRVIERTEVSGGSTVQRDEVFKTLHEAIASNRRIEMDYFDFQAGETSRRMMEPYGLLYRRLAWYCVGRCLQHDATRKFRLSRISSIGLTPFTFEVPKDFSMKDYLAGSWELFDGEPVEVLIRFSARVAPLVIDRPPRPEQSIQQFNDGSILYSATVNGTDEICWWLAQYGAEAEVLRPEGLRMKLLDVGRQIVGLYSSLAPGDERPSGRAAESPAFFQTPPVERDRPADTPS